MVNQEVVRDVQTSLAKQKDHSYGLGSTLPEDGSGGSSFSAGTLRDQRTKSAAKSSCKIRGKLWLILKSDKSQKQQSLTRSDKSTYKQF